VLELGRVRLERVLTKNHQMRLFPRGDRALRGFRMWPPAGSGVAVVTCPAASAAELTATRWPDTWFRTIGWSVDARSRSKRVG
jgi:hypothetical protein